MALVVYYLHEKNVVMTHKLWKLIKKRFYSLSTYKVETIEKVCAEWYDFFFIKMSVMLIMLGQLKLYNMFP